MGKQEIDIKSKQAKVSEPFAHISHYINVNTVEHIDDFAVIGGAKNAENAIIILYDASANFFIYYFQGVVSNLDLIYELFKATKEYRSDKPETNSAGALLDFSDARYTVPRYEAMDTALASLDEKDQLMPMYAVSANFPALITAAIPKVAEKFEQKRGGAQLPFTMVENYAEAQAIHAAMLEAKKVESQSEQD